MTFNPDAEVRKLFNQRWTALHSTTWDENDQLRYPGVYLLAYTERRLAGRKVQVDDVYYVGMSNAAGGVRARLNRFKGAIEYGGRHSGGKNFFRMNRAKAFSKLGAPEKFYFAALCLECTSLKSSATFRDFRVMGRVTCLEYYALARVKKMSRRKKVPRLNLAAGGVLVETAEERAR